jgi:hypothetical protein
LRRIFLKMPDFRCKFGGPICLGLIADLLQ